MERRRLLGAVWIVCAVVLVWAGTAAAQYGGGSGTADDPYLIYTPEQLNAIGADPNDWDKHFQLRADLDLSAYTGDEFHLIGGAAPARGPSKGETIRTPFSGVFDGNGHTVMNFTYTALVNRLGVGLFRHVAGTDTEIKNLGLIEPYVSAEGCAYVGPLVGYFVSGTVTGCYVAGGAVRGSGTVGGLVGWSVDGNVIDCYATAAVAGIWYVGGCGRRRLGRPRGDNRTVLRGRDSRRRGFRWRSGWSR